MATSLKKMNKCISRNNRILFIIMIARILFLVFPIVKQIVEYNFWDIQYILGRSSVLLSPICIYLSFVLLRKNKPIIVCILFALAPELWSGIEVFSLAIAGDTYSSEYVVYSVVSDVPVVATLIAHIVYILRYKRNKDNWYGLGIAFCVFHIFWYVFIKTIIMRYMDYYHFIDVSITGIILVLLFGLQYVFGFMRFTPKKHIKKLSYLEQYKKDHNL